MMITRIISFLKKNKQGISYTKIAAKLHLSPKEKRDLTINLQKLQDQGVIRLARKRYFFHPRSTTVRGTFVTSQLGFGFVRPNEEMREDIYIHARNIGRAHLGDVVEVLVEEFGRKGKPEGRIIRILEKKRKRILGIYRERSGQPFFQSLDSPQDEEVPLQRTSGFRLLEGTIVGVERDTNILKEVLGFPDDPGVDTQVVIKNHNLIASFSAQAEKDAAAISERIPESEIRDRVDYRKWRSVTIDGEKSQDFDDAVSVRKLPGGNTLLGVHIADVSFYVQPGSILDEEAFVRGTSVYFPDLTLPLFPEKISNEICSLRPREDKLTMSVLLEIDGDGQVVSSEFYPSVIHTEERLTYDSVFKIYSGDKEEKEKYASLVPDLLLMLELAERIRKKRVQEGSLDFDLLEPELVYKEGMLQSVLFFARNKAHQVIEEFMIAANEAVASFLVEKNVEVIFRVHPPPSVDALTQLREILALFQISLPKDREIRSKDIQRVLEQFAGVAGEKYLSIQVLKSLSRAVYATENTGHYGLAKALYTHFTSPIRRYPDLIVHRLLKDALKKKVHDYPSLDSAARHCSELERNAEQAEKDLVRWRIFRFLKGKLGDELGGIVIRISRAGLFVELEDYLVSGLVPFYDLGGGYVFSKKEQQLVNRRTGKTFKLGESVQVVLAAVDPVLQRLTLVLSESVL
ncbi:MAG: ribonuclease R [Candidatus Aminicenantes bacterium]|nr:ribonuclease R [Candidatus Aminicenantes bacterium]